MASGPYHVSFKPRQMAQNLLGIKDRLTQGRSSLQHKAERL